MAFYLQSSSTSTGQIQMDVMSQGVGGGATRISWDIEIEAIRNGTDFIPAGRLTDSNLIIFLKSDDSFELRVRNQTFNVTAATMGIAGTDSFHKYRLQHRETSTVFETTLFVDDVEIQTFTLDGADQYDLLFETLFALGGSTRHGGIKYYSYTDNITAANSRFYDANASGGTGTVVPETTGNGSDGTQVGTWEADDSEWVSYSSGPSISSSPSTAFPGQPRTVTGTAFGATQGTGGVTIGGVAQTITAWSDTSVSFTTVLGTNSYGTGKTLELTTDSSETDTATIELVADTAGGFGVVTMSSPNTEDDSSVAFNATPTVVTGDQFEWEDFNALGNLVIGADGFVESVDTEGTFRGRFWDATDSTWGTVENFTATVPDEIGPATTSVNVPNAATYAIGDTLSFTVNWDENANVTGTPRLPLTFGSGTRYADYASGTGTTALLFSYTVQEGDEDADGIAVNTIELNGGTIQDSNNNAATLTLNGVENTAGIIVDGIRPVISVGNTTTSDTTPTVSGSAGDATSLTLVVTGIGTYNPTPSGGSWSQTLPESDVGQYDMTLDGTDVAGNTAVQASGTLNIIEQGSWPYGLGIKPSIPITWEWGNRHPVTGMRVRLFKRGGQ